MADTQHHNFLRKAIRFATFSLSTLVGTAVDTLVLWLFAHLVLQDVTIGDFRIGANYIAPTISFFFATIANFIMAYFFVWRDRITKRSCSSFVKHYIGYLGGCIGGFIVKMCFLQLFLYIFDIDVIFCNLIALCFSGVFNFVLNECLVFRRKKSGNIQSH